MPTEPIIDPVIIIGSGIRVGGGITIGANGYLQPTLFITEISLDQFVNEAGTAYFMEET